MARYKSRDLTKREKSLFSHFTILVMGNLPSDWNEASINRWITLRGGTYIRESREVDWRAVTHLVCDEKEFDRRGLKVKEALKIARINIVAIEWLEFSMINKKVLPIREYSFREKLKKEREEERRVKEVAKGNELAGRAVNTNFYCVYYDGSHFRYQIELTRDIISSNETDEKSTEREKYILTLHESIAIPRLYWFVAKFSKSKHDSQPKYYRPSDTPGLFEQEFELFKSFFRIKTGTPWERRLMKKTQVTDGSSFQYSPPTGGKPVG
ncbi:hypothetical protein QBC42DRAFT_168391, partial [Cladorrhinum samala]